MIENEGFQTVTATNIVVIGNEAFEIVTARSPDCFTLLSAMHFADPKGSHILYIILPTRFLKYFKYKRQGRQKEI